jgi:hypothetical protein
VTSSAVRAGLLYAGAVFAAGFALGVLRVLLLVPRLGEVASVLLELPVMLALSWILCGRVLRRIRVPSEASARVQMGGVALLVLWVAEAVMLVVLGTPVAEVPAAFVGGAGRIGILGQIVFATFPLLRRTH